MVGKEGCPGLPGVPRRGFPSSLAHVAADSTPIDLSTEFPQFAPDTFDAPSPILDGHPLDQGDRLLVKPRLASWRLGFVSPEQLEPAAMPLEQGVGFDKQQGSFPIRQAAGEHDKQASVKRREGWMLHLPFQDDELLA